LSYRRSRQILTTSQIRQNGGGRVNPSRSPDNLTAYSRTSVTRPAPMVRPPSRIAKRRPFSIATDFWRTTSTVTLSPGITISTPAGSVSEPVTSEVRK